MRFSKGIRPPALLEAGGAPAQIGHVVALGGIIRIDGGSDRWAL
jgi:hypothetical protein